MVIDENASKQDKVDKDDCWVQVLKNLMYEWLYGCNSHKLEVLTCLH